MAQLPDQQNVIFDIFVAHDGIAQPEPSTQGSLRQADRASVVQRAGSNASNSP